MKFSDVAQMNVDELKKKKSGMTQELFEARLKNKLGQLGNPLQIRHLRRDLARINTALSAKLKA